MQTRHVLPLSNDEVERVLLKFAAVLGILLSRFVNRCALALLFLKTQLLLNRTRAQRAVMINAA